MTIPARSLEWSDVKRTLKEDCKYDVSNPMSDEHQCKRSTFTICKQSNTNELWYICSYAMYCVHVLTCCLTLHCVLELKIWHPHTSITSSHVSIKKLHTHGYTRASCIFDSLSKSTLFGDALRRHDYTRASSLLVFCWCDTPHSDMQCNLHNHIHWCCHLVHGKKSKSIRSPFVILAA